MPNKASMKPTRREAIAVAIDQYNKRLRTKACQLRAQAVELDGKLKEIAQAREELLLDFARKSHADILSRLRELLQPFDGEVNEWITRNGCEVYYNYSATVTHRELITSFPDFSDLDKQIGEINQQLIDLRRMAGDLERQAQRNDTVTFFNRVVSCLPPDADDLLNRLADTIETAIGDFADLDVIVYEVGKDNLSASVVEINRCHSISQANSLGQKLGEKYGHGYRIEIVPIQR